METLAQGARACLGWLLLASLMITPALSRPSNVATFRTGNDLFDACSGQDSGMCAGYIMGIADAMSSGSVNGFRACIPPGVILGQIQDGVVQYLYSNVQSRQRGAAGLVAEALNHSFPCTK